MSLSTATTEMLVGASSIEIGDLKRMTIHQYEELARLGVLDDPRVELVNGFMVRKMTQGLNHTSTLDVIEKLIRDLLPENWYLRAERPVRLPNYDEPEPDLAILRGNPGDYRLRQPGPVDVGLIVEVSDSSLRLDRGDKLRAYARSGIVHYWIVNLVDRLATAASWYDAAMPASPIACRMAAANRPLTRTTDERATTPSGTDRVCAPSLDAGPTSGQTSSASYAPTS